MLLYLIKFRIQNLLISTCFPTKSIKAIKASPDVHSSSKLAQNFSRSWTIIFQNTQTKQRNAEGLPAGHRKCCTGRWRMIWAFKVTSPLFLWMLMWTLQFKWLRVVWGLKGNSQGRLFPARGWWRMFISAALLGGEEINWKLLCKHVRGVSDVWAELFSKHNPLSLPPQIF